MGTFLKKLTSIRIAVWLITYLVAASALSTLVPRGLPEARYLDLYPRLAARLIVGTGFDDFFVSAAFILPALAFFANLSACTVVRFAKELKKKKGRRHGADILHLGLVLLVAGAIWSYAAKREGSMTLLPGDSARLPDGAVLTLRDFEFLRYTDGRPRAWTSVVDIEKDGKIIKESVRVSVNKPLRYGGYAFYQSSYSDRSVLTLSGAGGESFMLRSGVPEQIGDSSYLFMGTEAGGGADPGSAPAAIVHVSGPSGERTLRALPGEAVGELALNESREVYATGLQVVSDPAFPLVFAAFFLVAAGTAIVFIGKIREGS